MHDRAFGFWPAVRALAIALATALPSYAQDRGEVTADTAYRDVVLRNRTSSGSTNLAARIFYPSLGRGIDLPLDQRYCPAPVYVFLHGQGSLGRAYVGIGEFLAARGFVVVLLDTASTSALQADATAMFHTLVAENQATGSFWLGALDMTRAAIGGYSSGGGSTLRTLAANPGYKAGFVHAPSSGGSSTTTGPQIRVPVCIAQGMGDTVVNWQSSSLAWFTNMRNSTGQRVLYLMDSSVNHLNIASAPTAADLPIYFRVLRVCAGFLESQLNNSTHALDRVVGDDARTEPRLVRIYTETDDPVCWQVAAPVRNATLQMRVLAEAGSNCLSMVGTAADAPLPTVFGALRLDPRTIIPLISTTNFGGGLWSWSVPVPDNPALRGVALHFQCLAPGRGSALELTNLVGSQVR